MFRTIRSSTRLLALVATVAAALDAQGPASCGFHLEFIGGLTSTHAAVADMPSAPGSGTGMAPGAAGNPYTAYTTGGSPISLIISVPVGTIGSAPIGAGSCITLFYRLGAGVFPTAAAPPLLPTCDGSPLIIGVLPITGAIVDSCAILGSTPISTFVDPGWPNRFTLTGVYAPFAPPAVTFQAALITSGGNIAVTNAVTVFMGPNPNETSRLVSLTACGAGNALDDGQAIAIPAPAGFSFYGVPVAITDMDTNGFLDFAPGPFTAGACDPSGGYTDLGCAPPSVTARPRVEVNHTDWAFNLVAPNGVTRDMTTEVRPAGANWPAATIFRWKHASISAGTATSNFACELLGDSRIVVVRSNLLTHDQVGIGPGLAGQGFGGPPSVLATCSLGVGGLSFVTVYGVAGGFVAAPGGAIHMDTAANSALLLNLACVFVPSAGPPPITYTLRIY